jgi:hypothetical protein
VGAGIRFGDEGQQRRGVLLPPQPSRPGFNLFEYTVKATSSDGDEVTREATYDIAVPAPAGSCAASRP